MGGSGREGRALLWLVVAEDEVDAGWIPMWIWWCGGGDEWIGRIRRK